MLNLKKLLLNKKENKNEKLNIASKIEETSKIEEQCSPLSSKISNVGFKRKFNSNPLNENVILDFKQDRYKDLILENFIKNPFIYPLNQTTFFYSLKFELSNFHPSIIRYENNQFYFHQSFSSLNMKDEIETLAKVDNPLIFISNEQFFMWCKAMFFKDIKMMEKILDFNKYEICQKFIHKDLTAQDIVRNEKYADEWQKIQMGIKVCGRKVNGFDEEKWDKVKEDFMLNGLRLKFFQNNHLKEKLLNTKTVIAEASAKDMEWGIGMSIYDIQKYKNEHLNFNLDLNLNEHQMTIEVKGKNLLGKSLMKIKESLKSLDGLF